MSLKFTLRARAAVKKLLDETEHDEGQLVRMVPDLEGNFHLTLDVTKKGDEIIDYLGQPVMVIQRKSRDHILEHCTGDTLDVLNGPDGAQLVLTNSTNRVEKV